jgi:predicted amino acid dehydrogenase
LGATSGGASIDVQKLVSGTIVIDDSFPPAFSIAQAKKRMDTSRDVLLMGGGTFDLGRLERSSPFPQAKKIRAEYGSRWIPGCMAEAILLGLRPELGPTVGIVTLERAQKLLGISQELGWRAAKPHLDTWDVPKALLDTLMELYKD